MVSPHAKIALAAVVICLLLVHVTGLSLQQLKSMSKMPRQMCMQRTGVSKDLVDKLHAGQFVEDPKLKCYTKCCMGMMQSMKKDVYSLEAAMAQAEKLLPDSHKARTKVVLEKCKDSAAGMIDGCDVAFAITKCNYEADPEATVVVGSAFEVGAVFAHTGINAPAIQSAV